jgi:diadenosine tetraphosphate (Ap4A) HIT family hydrolase
MEAPCPFCQILVDDAKNQIIERSEHFTAIRKPYFSKNVNFLIISNTHVPNLKGPEDIDMNAMVAFVKHLSGGRDWSITINNGPKARQEVFHLHAHISSSEESKTWGI